MYRIIISTTLIVFAIISNTTAFPQRSLNIDDIYQVDGFSFNGPIERRPSSSTEATPTPVTQKNKTFENCIARCPITPEYNPVCGSDNVNYGNPGKLNCAIACGKDVSLVVHGNCYENPRG